MARTERRGKRGRSLTKPQGRPAGPPTDPEDDIFDADEKGKIKPLRPNRKWLDDNTEEVNDESE